MIPRCIRYYDDSIVIAEFKPARQLITAHISGQTDQMFEIPLPFVILKYSPNSSEQRSITFRNEPLRSFDDHLSYSYLTNIKANTHPCYYDFNPDDSMTMIEQALDYYNSFFCARFNGGCYLTMEAGDKSLLPKQLHKAVKFVGDRKLWLDPFRYYSALERMDLMDVLNLDYVDSGQTVRSMLPATNMTYEDIERRKIVKKARII